jgi:hypothetical protein
MLALPAFALGQANSIELGSDSAEFGGTAEISITTGSDSEVQGLVVVIEMAGGTGTDLVAGPAIADADTVATRVESDYAILGVVMDSDGADGEVIPAGSAHVGTLVMTAGDAAGDFDIIVAADGAGHALVDGGPALDNILVIGGQSIGRGEGLETINGTLSVLDCVSEMSIGGSPSNDTNGGAARVMLRNCADVEGYVVALCHDPADLTLESIAVGDAANAAGAEFSASEIFDGGGTLGVILDVEPPFDGQVLAPGTNNIAIYTYSAIDSDNERTTTLEFCDGALGDPLKDNVIVVGGLSVGEADGLVLTDGTYAINAEAPPPPSVTTYACGGPGGPGDVTASVGGSADVCFHILNPSDHIQGFSMAVSYDASLSAGDTFDTSGTILEAIGAEFVSLSADNAASNLVIGVLVDALPPFDGATVPPLATYQRMGCVEFSVAADDALCGQSLGVGFTDGVDGGSGVPAKNLVSIENQASAPQQAIDCNVVVVGEEVFFRGDCNFSGEGMGMAVNIADAAATVSFLFPTFSPFDPPCLDACDCNDDGRIDLADVMCSLGYQFSSGAAPPPPGSGLGNGAPGVDPTEDRLDCAAGAGCN